MTVVVVVAVLVVAVLAAARTALPRRTAWGGDLRLRSVRLLAAAAVLQVGVALLAPGRGWVRLVSTALSVALVAVFLAANRRAPGVPLIGLGLALNVAVIAGNGVMPVSMAAAARAGIAAADLRLDGDSLREPVGEGTRWGWLGDTIPFALPVFPQVVSPGDLLVAAGVGLLLIGRRPDPPRRAN